MIGGWSLLRGCAAAILVAAVVSTAGAAQLPPGSNDPAAARGRRAGKAAPSAPLQTITPQQIQAMFDSMVLSRAQQTLALTDQQWAVFIPKLLNYQKLQQRHRQQRQRLLAELRGIAGPNAPAGTDETAVAEKTKALDDLELQIVQDEQKSLQDLDAVLNARQRARFRLFIENMEREKISLLVRAQQGRGTVGPPVAPADGRPGR